MSLNPLLSLQHLGPTGLALLVAPSRIKEMERIIIPELAMRGNVHVIVGGHGLDADAILRAIRSRTPDAVRIRERVRVRRAPTAYSMRAALQDTPLTHEPLIILNFLATFYDPDREHWKSWQALQESINELNRLQQLAPIMATVRPPPDDKPEFVELFRLLQQAAIKEFHFQPATAPQQMTLF
ncbi:MAG: hypothetical protein JXA42_09780 [Anaerolineales bacterium]|nr:hypothetical protein [Anaerolineales bacterium]